MDVGLNSPAWHVAGERGSLLSKSRHFTVENLEEATANK
jgi:hypothetical protein